MDDFDSSSSWSDYTFVPIDESDPSGGGSWLYTPEETYTPVEDQRLASWAEQSSRQTDDARAAWEGMGNWKSVDSKSQWQELTAKPDTDLYGVRVFKDATDPAKPKYLTITPGGEYILDGEKIWSPSGSSSDWGKLLTKLGNFATSPAGMATILGTAYGMGAGNKPQTGGWKGSIPNLTATREQVKMPEYQPYSGKAVMGGKFFTDTQYTPVGNAEALQAAQTAAKTTAEKLAATNPKAPAAAVAPESYLKAAPKRDMSGLREIYRMPGAPQLTKSGIALGSTEPVGPPDTRTLGTPFGMGGAKAPQGYVFGPADELMPDTIKTPQDYENWKKSQGVQTAPNVKPDPFADFYTSPEYKTYQENQLGGIHTMDMYDSPYFGSMPSGSVGQAKDKAYTDYLNRTGQSSLIKPRQQTNIELPPIQTDGQGNVLTAASGGLMDLGRYLSGPTDGMADKIPSSIDGEQPAKLSHGEFVIPADVVSHLGNGNSDAGAEQLYKMMDRVRKARTGTTEQGKKIDPDKFTPGGIAGYATGGPVAFQTGGSADTALSRTASSNLLGATQETNLAPWVGDYVGNMLGRAQALAGTGYEAYTGPLSAGTSPLQQQAFNAAGQLNPQATFDTAAAQQYMNPFIEMSLKPQLEEMRRQAEISRVNTAGRLAQAGAYGGGRQAIMESELLRNLGQQQALTTGKAYETAFDKAMNQYNVGRQQTLADIGALSGLGQQERQIEQQGIDQLRGEFEKQRQFPYEQLKFQQSMLQGLPIGSTTITPNTSPLSQLGLTTEQVGKFSDWLNKNVFNTPPG